VHILEIMRMEFVLEKAYLFMMMALFMKETGKMTTCQVMEG